MSINKERLDGGKERRREGKKGTIYSHFVGLFVNATAIHVLYINTDMKESLPDFMVII